MAHFTVPSHVFVGKQALSEAAPYIRTFGKKALIVTGKHVGKSSMMDQLKKTLIKYWMDFVVFDDVVGEPNDYMVELGLKLFRESGAHFVIGIGGGSPLDTAKAIAAMSVNEGRISDYNGKEICGDVPGIVAIPTTAGTGSEATKFTVITDREKDIKMLLKGDCLIPDVVVLNHSFSIDMPKSVTAMTGLDALTHAVESYTSKKASPLTDVYAVSAVKRIMKYLPQAYHNGFDERARQEMSLAAYEAGICINNSSVTLVHGMSRPIGALFHVPHGMSNAMLLAVCLEFALDGAQERFAALGREIGAAHEGADDRAAAEAFVKAVKALCRECKIPTLKQYGVEKAAFDRVVEKMAADAMASGSPQNTRKDISAQDCIALYQKLYV